MNIPTNQMEVRGKFYKVFLSFLFILSFVNIGYCILIFIGPQFWSEVFFSFDSIRSTKNPTMTMTMFYVVGSILATGAGVGLTFMSKKVLVDMNNAKTQQEVKEKKRTLRYASWGGLILLIINILPASAFAFFLMYYFVNFGTSNF